MNRKRKILTALFAVTFACFTSCSGSGNGEKEKRAPAPKPKQIIKINIVSEPLSLDPRRARCLGDLNLTKMFMEGLTRLNSQDEPVMAAAESVSVSEDGTIYTFTLRDSKWSNGDKVTSSDFAYAWKKVLSPDFPAPMAYQLNVIKNAKDIKMGELPTSLLGVSCPNDNTLVIELEHPVPYFLKLTALPTFYPVHQMVDRKNQNWAFSFETYVGNGPFCIDSWSHYDKIVATKNPGYWDQDNIQLEQIEMLMVSEDAGLKMFENNEIQWEGSPFAALPTDAMQKLSEDGVIRTKPFLGTYWIQTNTEKRPLNSEKLRKAFALSINRQDIVDYVTQGNQIPTTSIVPAAISLSEKPYFQDGDSRKAAILLEEGISEASLSRDDMNEIRLTYIAEERPHKIAQALQQQWFEALGVLVKLEPVDRGIYQQKLQTGEFDLACSDWIGDVSDPINFLEVFKSKSMVFNASNWENPEYSTLLENSFNIQDSNKRDELLRRAEKMVVDAMPAIPVFNYSMVYVKDEKVKHVGLSSTGQIDFRHAYVESI